MSRLASAFTVFVFNVFFILFLSVARPPTIDGIFGKDWCMNLWKDRDPYSLQRCPDLAQSADKVNASYTRDAATCSQQEALSTEGKGEEKNWHGGDTRCRFTILSCFLSV